MVSPSTRHTLDRPRPTPRSVHSIPLPSFLMSSHQTHAAAIAASNAAYATTPIIVEDDGSWPETDWAARGFINRADVNAFMSWVSRGSPLPPLSTAGPHWVSTRVLISAAAAYALRQETSLMATPTRKRTDAPARTSPPDAERNTAARAELPLLPSILTSPPSALVPSPPPTAVLLQSPSSASLADEDTMTISPTQEDSRQRSARTPPSAATVAAPAAAAPPASFNAATTAFLSQLPPPPPDALPSPAHAPAFSAPMINTAPDANALMTALAQQLTTNVAVWKPSAALPPADSASACAAISWRIQIRDWCVEQLKDISRVAAARGIPASAIDVQTGWATFINANATHPFVASIVRHPIAANGSHAIYAWNAEYGSDRLPLDFFHELFLSGKARSADAYAALGAWARNVPRWTTWCSVHSVELCYPFLFSAFLFTVETLDNAHASLRINTALRAAGYDYYFFSELRLPRPAPPSGSPRSPSTPQDFDDALTAMLAIARTAVNTASLASGRNTPSSASAVASAPAAAAAPAAVAAPAAASAPAKTANKSKGVKGVNAVTARAHVAAPAPSADAAAAAGFVPASTVLTAPPAAAQLAAPAPPARAASPLEAHCWGCDRGNAHSVDRLRGCPFAPRCPHGRMWIHAFLNDGHTAYTLRGQLCAKTTLPRPMAGVVIMIVDCNMTPEQCAAFKTARGPGRVYWPLPRPAPWPTGAPALPPPSDDYQPGGERDVHFAAGGSDRV